MPLFTLLITYVHVYIIIFPTDTVSTMTTDIYSNAVAFSPLGSVSYILTTTQLLMKPVGGGPSSVSVLAGQSVSGFADGQGAAAKFNNPRGLVVHPLTGVAYITDHDNNRIRTCTAQGLVSTLAGSATSSNVDGVASIATFNGPVGIVMDPSSVFLYVTCDGSMTLRRVNVTSGFTTTLVSSGLGTPSYVDQGVRLLIWRNCS